VVHHCIAFTRPPDGASFREIGLLSAFVPGQLRSPLPEGYAQRIRAGSRIVFQMHYTPNGKVEQDLTRLGLVFADPNEVTHEVISLGGIQQEFEIPPRTPHHVVDGRIGWFPRDGQLLSIMPHMHLRGKAFEFRIERGNLSETVLKVPAYDFNWQHNYELTTPLPLNDVDELSFSAIFDNSSDNPFNPDPSELVTWGDQTWQEMAVTFISVARPLGKGRRESQPELSKVEQEQVSERREDQEQRAREFADSTTTATASSPGTNCLTPCASSATGNLMPMVTGEYHETRFIARLSRDTKTADELLHADRKRMNRLTNESAGRDCRSTSRDRH
jgi:hypothetical protein